MQSLLLQAFKGENETVPVWFMRQAGRYLPAYRVLKKKYTLQEMFTSVDLAAHITCLPVDVLKVDAAILFADILTMPSGMGFEVQFNGPQGPVIANPVRTRRDVKRVYDFSDLAHISKIIKLVNKSLPGNVPLIGFAGAPFTVLCYLVEGGASVNFAKTLRFAFEEPKAFHQLMAILTKSTIRYFQLQRRAGVKVFQLFDSWAGILRPDEFIRWNLPFIKQIFDEIDLPSIYYARAAGAFLPYFTQCRMDFLSVCHAVPLKKNEFLHRTRKGVQGNFYSGILYADYPVVLKELNKLLTDAREYKQYVFNLSQGVFADVEVEKLKFIVEKVHAFKWKQL